MGKTQQNFNQCTYQVQKDIEGNCCQFYPCSNNQSIFEVFQVVFPNNIQTQLNKTTKKTYENNTNIKRQGTKNDIHNYLRLYPILIITFLLIIIFVLWKILIKYYKKFENKLRKEQNEKQQEEFFKQKEKEWKQEIIDEQDILKTPESNSHKKIQNFTENSLKGNIQFSSSDRIKESQSLKHIQIDQDLSNKRKMSEYVETQKTERKNQNSTSIFDDCLSSKDENSDNEDIDYAPEDFFNSIVSQSMSTDQDQQEKVMLQYDIPYENKKFQNSFTDLILIGSGAFGQVYQALYKIEDRYYAVKQIPVKIKEHEDLRKMAFFREVQTMVNLRKDGFSHQNIVEYVTCWVEEIELEEDEIQEKSAEIYVQELSNEEQSSEDSNFEIIFEIEETKKPEKTFKKNKKVSYRHLNLYIQMEFCTGRSLNFYLLNQDIVLENKFIFLIFISILEGLIYLHEKFIIHRDLKPANILIGKNSIKIGDFGLATIAQKKKNYSQSHSQSIQQSNKKIDDQQKKSQFSKNIGTPLYASPEQENSTNYNEKADIFSLGIILFECLMCFKTQHARIKQLITLRKTGKVPKDLREQYPDESELIEMLVQQDADKRPSGYEIKETDCYKNWAEKVQTEIQIQKSNNDQQDIDQILQLNHFLVFVYVFLFLFNILNQKVQIQIYYIAFILQF